MEFDVLTAGIEPGGLRSKNDIKLLICYILSNIKCSLSKEDVVSILQENNFANYFEANSAFSELIENENICKDPENSSLYKVTEIGRLVSAQLDTALPISIREKALCATINLLAKLKRETENKVTVTENADGYYVNCNISGGNIDLLSISLYVPDCLQADLVKHNFQERPELIYECTLALLTKDNDLINNILKSLN
ncbi:MAG: hypothetical protein RUMPE_00693 [Eubacteriales bacterium SKADARSKE-1]|nr:hypothetical protein [Eubacteriales bacterium SKADARSKE-1]